MPLIHAYRIVKDDRIKGTLAPVERTEIVNDDVVEIHFKNGGAKTFPQDQILNVSNRTGAIRPKHKPGTRRFGL